MPIAKASKIKPEIGVTNMSNLLEKFSARETLNAKDLEAHEKDLISVFKQIHDCPDVWAWIGIKSTTPPANILGHGDPDAVLTSGASCRNSGGTSLLFVSTAGRGAALSGAAPAYFKGGWFSAA